MVTVNDMRHPSASSLAGCTEAISQKLQVVVCLQVKDEEQEAAKFDAVFPCILRILPACVFNKKDPIIVGVDIEEGIAKVPLTSHMLTSLMQPCLCWTTQGTLFARFTACSATNVHPNSACVVHTIQSSLE